MPKTFTVPRVPRELDPLAIHSWLAEHRAEDPAILDKALQRAAHHGRPVTRELARRRRHALRMDRAQDSQEADRERVRRHAEKALHPWPDHWRSY